MAFYENRVPSDFLFFVSIKYCKTFDFAFWMWYLRPLSVSMYIDEAK